MEINLILNIILKFKKIKLNKKMYKNLVQIIFPKLYTVKFISPVVNMAKKKVSNRKSFVMCL